MSDWVLGEQFEWNKLTGVVDEVWLHFTIWMALAR